MNKCFAFCVGLFLALGVTHSANATLVELDFEDLNNGDVLTDQYAALGVIFESLSGFGGAEGPIAWDIGDTTYAPGGTGIAISPYTPTDTDPNPNDPFYDIQLNFSTPIDYVSFYSLDSDEPLWVYGYYQGVEVANVYMAPGTDLQQWHVELGGINGPLVFDTIVLDLVRGGGTSGVAGGPEFYDNFSFNTTGGAEIPEPSTLLLLGAGLAGLIRRGRVRA